MSSTGVKKVGTKGQKQIHEENVETLRQYSVMALVGVVVQAVGWGVAWSGPWGWHWWLVGVGASASAAALLCMRQMAAARRNEKGGVVDAGLDLNAEGGFGEHCKDVVILALAAHLLSAATVYAHFLLLAAPLYAAYKLWTGLISPWIFAEAPEESDADLKRRAKKERKVKRI